MIRAWGAWGAVVVASCGGTEAPGDECSELADTCAGTDVCMNGYCRGAFPRSYSITDVELHMGTKDLNMQPWDTDGGPPDLFLQVTVDDRVTATTDPFQDSYNVTFDGPFDVHFVDGSSLLVSAFDSDVETDHFAFSCMTSPINVEELRQRDLHCTAAGSSMTFRIDPK